MALVASEKKGGPPTKNEQEKRRNEVYRLHFEYGYSAVKIAELMKFNRNTINSDINFWYSQVSKDWKERDIGSLILKQFQRMEEQRGRLREELEKQDQLNNKLVIERLIFDVDNKLTQIITKVMPSESFSFSRIDLNDIKDDSVKKIVRYLVTKNPRSDKVEYTKNEILYEIIMMKKCDLEYAELILQKMRELGLEINLYSKLSFDGKTITQYNLKIFAQMRRYLSKKEVADYEEQVVKLEKEETRILDEREKKLYEKYGKDMSKWSEEVFKKYDEIDSIPTPLQEKYSDI